MLVLALQFSRCAPDNEAANQLGDVHRGVHSDAHQAEGLRVAGGWRASAVPRPESVALPGEAPHPKAETVEPVDSLKTEEKIESLVRSSIGRETLRPHDD
jgi:hypothetical protein